MDTAVKEVVGHYIGGQLVSGSSGRFGDVYNPATGEVVASVASMSESEVYKAVEAGKSALRLTSPYSIETRRKWLEDIRDAHDYIENRKQMGKVVVIP